MHARTERIAVEPERSGTRVPDHLIDAFADANSAVSVFDAAGRSVHANAEMQRLEAALGDAVATLVGLAPDDRTSAAFVDFERFRAGHLDKLRLRYALRRDTGALLWIDLSARRKSFAPTHEPLAVVQIFDVTEAYEARAEMERNNARWETALFAAGQGLWEHDSTTGKLSVSQGWKRLRGIPDAEEVTFDRETWLSRLHPEDRMHIDQESSKQGRVDGHDTLEYRERHRDGHYIWIYSRGRPYAWDETGRVLLTIGTDTDITRPKEIENELALEKERLNVILQSIADGVISTDDAGTVTFINKAAVHMTGWSADAALGRTIDSVFESYVENSGRERTRTVESCLRHGRVFRPSGYTRLKSRSGRSRYVREIAAPVLNDKGKVIGTVMVFQDATQVRRFQRELEYSATHDALTGLPNRAAFEACLHAQIEQVAAGGSSHALCLVDLDKFKAVNDGAGHSAGDALLKQIGSVIKAACRTGDYVARLGGDEFGIILKDCSIKTSRRLMRAIIRKIGALRFEWQEQTFRVGASIGITAIDGSNINAIELYRNADNACYAAKRNGRNCEVVSG
ncbi:MAG: diguanylate cyclase [Alphaproteobacteria bacterium]|nr:diguanylate cyclase [Alphaproteobacteria bacterium]